MSFGPCMCGDPECWSCGVGMGGGISIAEGVYGSWDQPEDTKQDLADLCAEYEGEKTVPGPLDCEVWTFADGSSIEIVWGGCAPIVRDASGDVVP